MSSLGENGQDITQMLHPQSVQTYMNSSDARKKCIFYMLVLTR